MKKLKHVSVMETMKLIRLCNKHKITKTQLGKKLGLSQPSISRWFNNAIYPVKTDDLKQKIAAVFEEWTTMKNIRLTKKFKVGFNGISMLGASTSDSKALSFERALQEIERENQIKSFSDPTAYNWKNEDEKFRFFIENRGREDCREIYLNNIAVKDNTEDLRHLHAVRAHAMDFINEFDALLKKMGGEK